jgi:pyruvate, water dikinase
VSTTARRFASPYEDTAPAAAEGWQELYPYFLLFRDDRRQEEEAKFWFCDSQHWPSVFRPFETTMVEFAVKCLGQYNTRQWLIPPANGVDYRIHNGYCYMSPVAVPPDQIADRVPIFLERAGYYFQNWPTLMENWHRKVAAVIESLEQIDFQPLPEIIPMEWVTEGVGLDPTDDMIASYNRAIELCYRAYQYHFEFLNLGYAAYLDFFGFCKESFPDIPDQAIAKMVQGVEVDLFRPDDELKKLAKLAVALGLADALRSGDVDTTLARLAGEPGGSEWLEAWRDAQDPWFNYSSGNGFYCTDKVWLDYLDIPLGFIRDYIGRLEAGYTIDRPTEAVAAERERIARVVFPYVENHNFYIEHWTMSIFWRKVRQLGQVLADAGFWSEADDMFYLRREEIQEALFDYGNAWAVGTKPMGPYHWPAEVARRKAIVDALRTKRPLPAMNEPPEVVTEPFTIMLWGITSESVGKWLAGSEDGNELTGMAASPGIAEGNVRIVLSADDLASVEEGEILVTQVTAPSWAPVFGRIGATVTDIGGMMSHAAIVCREYGLPAVTGTGTASTQLRTGQRVRVDGNAGTVTIL